MSYSVIWNTGVITIPITDLVPVSGSRYQLLMSDFHKEIRRLEWAFDEGMAWPQILDHTIAKLDFAGADYAPFDEIINGYTVEFGPGPTRVDLIGSNNNIADVLIPTGVTVVTFNSAGLQRVTSGSGLSSDEHDMLYRLKHFERRVYVDTESSVNGDGSQGRPFNNQQDAADYAANNTITTLVALADIVLDRSFKNFTVIGVGSPAINLNGQDLDKSEFIACDLTGSYENRIIAKNCILTGDLHLNGEFDDCSLYGDFFIPDGGLAYLNNCSPRILDFSPKPFFDIGGASGTGTLLLMGYKGTCAISNCTSPSDLVRVSLDGGLVYIDESCTEDYSIGVFGNGMLINDSNCTVSDSNLINKSGIADTVLNTVSS